MNSFWFFALISFSVALLPLRLEALSLQENVERDLELLTLSNSKERVEGELLDVAIIGAGHSGLGLSLALRKEGVTQVALFDRAVKGMAGPWMLTARMLTLRSHKENPAIALGIPSLTFRSWYEFQYDDWDRVQKIPVALWAQYLSWYRDVLNITVHYEKCLLAIEPVAGALRLGFSDGTSQLAKTVVLATGRDGMGGFEVPSFVSDLPKSCWAHTAESYDITALRDKRVVVVGSGASAFDGASSALESGADRVIMIMRRSQLPTFNAWTQFPCWSAFFFLSDEKRVQVFEKNSAVGSFPPVDSLNRALRWPQFCLSPNTWIETCSWCNEQLSIQTNQGSVGADYLILGTGYRVDLKAVEHLKKIEDHILLWEDRRQSLRGVALGKFPYLGASFQFLEKNPGCAPYLSHIYCFNYAAFLSHGRVAGDLDELGPGLSSLARALALDLFQQSDEDTWE